MRLLPSTTDLSFLTGENAPAITALIRFAFQSEDVSLVLEGVAVIKLVIQSYSSVDIVFDVSPDDVFRALPDASTFMQQSALGLSMWEYRNTAHNRLKRVSIHHALSHAGDEVSSLTSLELVVEVDEEREK